MRFCLEQDPGKQSERSGCLNNRCAGVMTPDDVLLVRIYEANKEEIKARDRCESC